MNRLRETNVAYWDNHMTPKYTLWAELRVSDVSTGGTYRATEFKGLKKMPRLYKKPKGKRCCNKERFSIMLLRQGYMYNLLSKVGRRRPIQ
jgi:hypothetical protein